MHGPQPGTAADLRDEFDKKRVQITRSSASTLFLIRTEKEQQSIVGRVTNERKCEIRQGKASSAQFLKSSISNGICIINVQKIYEIFEMKENLWSLIPFLPLFVSFLVIFVKIRNRIENPRCSDETSLRPETTVPKSRVPRNSGQFFRKPKDPLCRFRFLNGPFLNTKQNDGKKDERDEARRGEPRRDWMRDEGSLDEDVSSRATFLSPVCSRPILSATERRTSIP